MPFSELRYPWENTVADMQECVSLLDYMDNYEVPFSKARDKALFLRTLQLSVALLETARPEQLSAAGIDISRICCVNFAENSLDWDAFPVSLHATTKIDPVVSIHVPSAIDGWEGLDASAFFGSHWRTMFHGVDLTGHQ
ncbi:hypothetical protein WBP07_30595 [Novosphingobium sp. BL-8A]|uniref:hypothetical protein n=1 Tax=Novosphingobium sp. BL-8A TaxID=3127639 RepID=UPI0037575C1A